MRPKGLRNVKTIQSMPRRNGADSREQAVAELARLEHEKARLLRELDVWRQNMRRTEEQLERVEGRLATLHQQIHPADEPAAPAARPRRPAPADDQPDPGWTSLSLEY